MSTIQKIKIGVVGLNFGTYIIENMILEGDAAPFFELSGICDTVPEKVEKYEQRYGCKGYTELDAMLEDSAISAIILMIGPNGRAEQIRKIIRAGKDVMTTKPFEQNSAAAESVLKEARALGRFVYLNSPAAIMNKDFAQIRAWETEYDLGKLVGAHHECWYKNVEAADGSWYDDPALCPAAPILRLGIYGLNDLIQFFDEPESVQVMQTRHFTGRPTPDMARLSVKFKSGAMVDTLDGWAHQPLRGANSLTLYYENGTIYRNPPLSEETMEGDKPATRLCLAHKNGDGTPDAEVKLQPDEQSSFYAWEAFYHAIKTRKRPEHETPDSAIVNVIKVLEAMKRASLSEHGYAKVSSREESHEKG